MKKIKIAIVDDDYLLVNLLKNFLDNQCAATVVYDTTDGNDFIKHLESNTCTEINILLLDLKMKTIDGLEVLKYIKKYRPDFKVIVVSSHYEDHSIGFMAKEGAAAFLPKGMSPFKLFEIIQHVMQNGFYLNNNQMTILREQISNKVRKPFFETGELVLTDREIEIIKLLCTQKTAKEIGEILFITQRTVEGHKNNIFSKTGVRNVSGLIVYALHRQIVTLDELTMNQL